MAAGGRDSQGIYKYGEDDDEATGSDLLNLLADSVSDRFASLPTGGGGGGEGGGLSSDVLMIGGSFRLEDGSTQSIPNGGALVPLLCPVEDLDRSPNNYEFHQASSPSKFKTTESMIGKWAFVIAKAQFAFNAAGWREVAIKRDDDTFDSMVVQAHPLRPTIVTCIRLERLKRDQTFEGFAAQNGTGGDLNVLAAATRLQVILVGDSPDVKEPEKPPYTKTGTVVRNWAYNPTALGTSMFIADPGGGSAPTISISATGGTNGPEAHKMVSTASSNSGVVTPIAERVPVVAGDTFAFAFDVRNAAAAARLFAPFLRWYAADKTTAVGAVVVGADVSIAAAAVGTLTLSAVAPAGAFYAAADMRRQGGSGSATGDIWYLDQLQYVVNPLAGYSIATERFNGATSSDPLTGPGFGYDWLAAAHASPSTRTAYVGKGEPPPPPPPPTGQDLIFDSAFASRGIQNFVRTSDMGENLIKIEGDPTGTNTFAKVARFPVKDSDKHPPTGSSSYPRSQIKTTTFLKAGGLFWIGLSICVPASTLAIDPDPYNDEDNQIDYGDNRLMIFEVFGSPHSKGPNRLNLRGNRYTLGAGNETGGKPDLGTTHKDPPYGSWNSGVTPPLRWDHFILGYKMSTDPLVGYVTLYTKQGGSPRGGGYTNQRLYQDELIAGEYRRRYRTLGPGNDDDNYATVKLSFADSPKDPNGGRMVKFAEVFHGRLEIGSTFASVGGA